MFMTATIATIVSSTPTHEGSWWMPTTGNVNACTYTPNHVGIAAAST